MKTFKEFILENPALIALGSVAGRALASAAGRKLAGSTGALLRTPKARDTAGKIGANLAVSLANKVKAKDKTVKKEEASPMIKAPVNEFGKKEDAFSHAKEHGGKVFKKTFIHPTSGQKNVSYIVKK